MRSARRVLIHLVRFVILAVVVLMVVELIFGAWMCLDTIEYVKTFKDIASCAAAPLLVFIWWQLATEIHLVLVIILASAATLVWAWRDRRRS
jgi:hypothetical protein